MSLKYAHPQVTFPQGVFGDGPLAMKKKDSQEIWGYKAELATMGHTYRLRADNCLDFPVGEEIEVKAQLQPNYRGDVEIFITGWVPKK